MFDISPVIRRHFNALLVKKAIPEKCHNEYRKWLRCYLDFCYKYHFHESKRESLPHFIKKLQGKNQTQEQQKQASHSIALYYELVQSGTKIINKPYRVKPSKRQEVRLIFDPKIPLKQKSVLSQTVLLPQCS